MRSDMGGPCRVSGHYRWSNRTLTYRTLYEPTGDSAQGCPCRRRVGQWNFSSSHPTLMEILWRHQFPHTSGLLPWRAKQNPGHRLERDNSVFQNLANKVSKSKQIPGLFMDNPWTACSPEGLLYPQLLLPFTPSLDESLYHICLRSRHAHLEPSSLGEHS